MKKITLLLASLATLSTGFSQVSKGDKLVGVSFGSISYTNSKSTTDYTTTPVSTASSDGNSFSISVNPNVAWFIQERLAVGGGVSVSFYSSKNNSTSTTGSTTYTSESKYTQPSLYIGPLARYYFGGSPKGMPFAQLNLQYGISGGKSNSKSTSGSGSSSETTTKPKGDWNAGLTFGYEHFITPSVGFYGSIGFNYGKSKVTYEYRPSSSSGYDYSNEYSRFYIPVNVGLQVHILNKGNKK